MSDLVALKKAFKAAKKAWQVNKEDKALKKVFKAAKTAFKDAETAAEAAPTKAEVETPKNADKKEKKNKKKRAAEDDAAPAEKKQKVADVSALEKAMKAAKKKWKADKSDKALKAAFKKAKKALEEASSSKTEEPEKVEEKEEEEEEEEADEEMKPAPAAPVDSSANPDGVTKLFVGNLSFNIDDDTVKDFFKDCGTITDIFWLEDKESGRFKGCGFLTFETADQATQAQAMSGQMLMERDIKIEFAKAKKDNGGGKSGGGKGGKPARGLSERPDNCVSVFCGNLSYDIDDDKMKDFVGDCGDVKAIRWLTDRESGDFKGCGFVEFYDSESVDKFVLKNGTDCLGRNIRIDYAAPRPPKEY